MRPFDDTDVQKVLNEAIDQADTEINSYVGMVPDLLPFADVPSLIENLSAKIAVYNLLRRRPSVPDHWQSEYKRCLATLEKIGAKKLSLGLSKSDDLINSIEEEPGAAIVSASKRWS